MRVAIIFNQFGPYHYARLQAAGRQMNLYGIELFRKSREYRWEAEGLHQNFSFQKVTLFDIAENLVSKAVLRKKIFDILDNIKPEAVAINGWSEAGALAALKWCTQNRVPAIVMSDSTEWDAPRTTIKESIKKQIVAQFSAALVAGTPHSVYMQKLGMPARRIFSKYDVVDNAHFSSLADEARKNAAVLRQTLGLPEQYFLASSRFVQKKNIPALLEAYSIYKKKAGSKAWDLVLVGDGELRSSLEELIRELGIEARVHLPGFIQYKELPTYYGLAKAFIQASTVEQWGLVVNEAMASGLPVLLSSRLGCAQDLVTEGENGFLFSPFEIQDIAAKMEAISSGAYDLDAFAAKSRAIISAYTPESFAKNLLQAALCAVSTEYRSGNIVNALTLNFLIHQ